MVKINLATILLLTLFVCFWMVDASKIGNSEAKRITTSRTSGSSSSSSSSTDGNVTIEAPPPHHHHRNAWPRMDKIDRRNLVERDCGRRNKKSKVKDAIRKFGANAVFTARTDDRGTCLHYAASYGNLKIINYLVEKGLDKFDPKDNNKKTPLRIAIRKHRYGTITLLIKLGADLEKAKVANYGDTYFEKYMGWEETIEAIEKGRRLQVRPRLTATPPSTIKVEIDSTVDIVCSAIGAVLKWFHKGVAIRADASHRITESGLKILNIKKYHSGRYECKAENSAGSASAHTTLYFQGGCDENWVSGNNKGCDVYSRNQWCTREGGYGSSWEERWISFEKWADSLGRSALVCPQCGCNAFKVPSPISWRSDFRCGRHYPINGKAGKCNPNGIHPCCNRDGYCSFYC